MCGFVIVVSFLLVAGIYLYGVNVGRTDCKQEYQQSQITIVENITKEDERVQETINSAGLDSIRRLLCETARDDCSQERTDNTSTSM